MSRKPTPHVEAPNPHAESIDASALKDLVSDHYGTKTLLIGNRWRRLFWNTTRATER